MKRRIVGVIVFVMICCLIMPTTIYAAEPLISGNDAVEDEPAGDEVVTEDEIVEDDNVEDDIVEDDPAVVGPTGGNTNSTGEVISGNDVEEDDEDEDEKSGGGSLAVDGYYDDWEGVPETLISYGSHNAGGTINEYHGGSMIVTEEYVYVHVRMSDLYQQQIPVDDLKLTINGVEKSFIIRGRGAQNVIDWNRNMYYLGEGTHGDMGIFYRDGGQIALGEAILTISDASPNDSFEFRMSIADLEALYGLPAGTIGNGAKLEFYSPNIGPEKVTVVGTPTGAYIGIAFGFVIELEAAFGINKRKQA